MARWYPVAMRCSIAIVALTLSADTAAAQLPAGVGGPQPPPGAIFLYPERTPLEGGGFVESERGLLFVPMSRADSSLGVVAVEVWRFPAQQPSGLPPVFRLPGGPGFEGVEHDIDLEYYQDVVEPYTRLQDYVVIGQRGIGSSKPNTICPIGGPAVAGGPADFSRQCRAYWEGRGLDRQGFTVVEAAADVADAAEALGYERVALRGTSFGSHWAFAVIRYHPELVAWAMLSGIEGPNHTYDSPSGFLRTLGRVAEAAEASPSLQNVLPDGGLMAALRDVRDRLAGAPVSVTVAGTTGGEPEVIRFAPADVPALSMGYTTYVGSREGAAAWPSDILRLYYGDFQLAARTWQQREERASSADERQGYATAAEYLLDCSSGITAERLEALRSDPAQELIAGDHEWYEEICAPWDVDAGDTFRGPLRTDVPTVLVHGTWDFSTPYDNALELAPGFSRGKLVTVVGGSHGALGEAIDADAGFSAGFWEFLQTGDLSVLPDSVVLPPVDWAVPADLAQLAAESRREPG